MCCASARAELILLLGLAALPAQDDPIPWREREVAVGVVWRSHRFADLYGAPQNVELLVLVPRGPATFTFIAAERPSTTSALAFGTRAVAAVNGGYFTKDGTPTGWLRVAEKEIGARRPQRDGVVARAADGAVKFGRCTELDSDGVTDALSAGPLLLLAAELQPLDGWPESHAQRRHPRTAVGRTAAGALVLLTVDGRTPQSAGMTCPELARFMMRLGCVDALNLDGGGSTTMWIRDEPDSGIVNHPCDNRAFDHAGERRVANAVLVLAPDILQQDDDALLLTEPEAWQRIADPAAYGGALLRGTAGSATWRVYVSLAGSYDVQLCATAGGGRFTLDGVELAALRPAGSWLTVGRVEIDQPRVVELAVRAASDPVLLDALRLVGRR